MATKKKVLNQVKTDVKFEAGTRVTVDGREGVFVVMSTGEWGKNGSRVVKGFMDDGGKIEWVDESALTPIRKGK